jgi:hypothetical protein
MDWSKGMQNVGIKRMVNIGLFITSFLFSVQSQAYFNTDNAPDNNASTSTTPAQAAPIKPLSPEEFKQLSKQYHEQTQKQLNQAYDDAVQKQPPLSSTSSNPTNSAPINTDSTKQPQAPVTTPAPTTAPSANANTLPPAPTPNNDEASPTPSKQPDYTGFGTGNAPANAAPANNTGNNSGGWNVKY